MFSPSESGCQSHFSKGCPLASVWIFSKVVANFRTHESKARHAERKTLNGEVIHCFATLPRRGDSEAVPLEPRLHRPAVSWPAEGVPPFTSLPKGLPPLGTPQSGRAALLPCPRDCVPLAPCYYPTHHRRLPLAEPILRPFCAPFWIAGGGHIWQHPARGRGRRRTAGFPSADGIARLG